MRMLLPPTVPTSTLAANLHISVPGQVRLCHNRLSCEICSRQIHCLQERWLVAIQVDPVQLKLTVTTGKPILDKYANLPTQHEQSLQNCQTVVPAWQWLARIVSPSPAISGSVCKR